MKLYANHRTILAYLYVFVHSICCCRDLKCLLVLSNLIIISKENDTNYRRIKLKESTIFNLI